MSPGAIASKCFRVNCGKSVDELDCPGCLSPKGTAEVALIRFQWRLRLRPLAMAVTMGGSFFRLVRICALSSYRYGNTERRNKSAATYLACATVRSLVSTV